MAIAFDAASQGGASQTTSKVVSHTAGVLTDGIAIAIVQIETGRTLSSAPTYDGVSMTLLTSYTLSGSVFDNTYFYYLVNPPSGTKNVVFTPSANAYVYAVVGTYQGVDQTNPFGSTPTFANNAASTSTSLTTSLITTVDNAWLVGMGQVGNGGGGVAAGSGTTRRATSYGLYDWHALLDSNGAKTPTGSYSLIHTGSSDRRGTLMAQLIPKATTPIFIPRVSFIM